MHDYHGHRLRQGRFSEPGRAYLVTTVTHSRRALFTDLMPGRALVAELRAAQERGWAESLAWVIMPDHLHRLFVLQETSLGTLMMLVKSRSARAINAANSGSGPIWQAGYHDRAIRRDDDVVDIARYIVANPLRARLVRTLGDYPLRAQARESCDDEVRGL